MAGFQIQTQEFEQPKTRAAGAIGSPPGSDMMIAAAGQAASNPLANLGMALGSGVEGLMGRAEEEKAAEAAKENYIWKREYDLQMDIKREAAKIAMKQVNDKYLSDMGVDEYKKKRAFDAELEYPEKQAKAEAQTFAQAMRKNPEEVQTVINIAKELGVEPELALAVWGQESSYSTDVNLPGKDNGKGRGRARGPFQVVEYYHPEFKNLNTFEEQARYAIGYLKKVGPEGYFGKGTDVGGQTTEGYSKGVGGRMKAIASVLYGGKGGKTDAPTETGGDFEWYAGLSSDMRTRLGEKVSSAMDGLTTTQQEALADYGEEALYKLASQHSKLSDLRKAFASLSGVEGGATTSPYVDAEKEEGGFMAMSAEEKYPPLPEKDVKDVWDRTMGDKAPTKMEPSKKPDVGSDATTKKSGAKVAQVPQDDGSTKPMTFEEILAELTRRNALKEKPLNGNLVKRKAKEIFDQFAAK